MNADPDAAGPGLNEALAVWAALGVVAAMVWITYARLPADVFYNVTGTGFRAGASRVLVLLGWPISIAAVALLAVAADRYLASSPPPARAARWSRRRVASALLCATMAWPGVIDEADLDAKPSNALAAVGVGHRARADARRRPPRGRRRVRAPQAGRRRRDRRSSSCFSIAGIPWILSNAGFYAGDVPGLRSIFMSKQILPEPGHPTLHAVHLGNHEGIDGILLAATALALRRVLPQMRPTRLHGLLGFYLALVLAYGRSWR